MSTDPVVDELHRQRAETMERFNFDFEAYVRYLKEQEKLTGNLLPPPDSPPRSFVQKARFARR